MSCQWRVVLLRAVGARRPQPPVCGCQSDVVATGPNHGPSRSFAHGRLPPGTHPRLHRVGTPFSQEPLPQRKLHGGGQGCREDGHTGSCEWTEGREDTSEHQNVEGLGVKRRRLGGWERHEIGRRERAEDARFRPVRLRPVRVCSTWAKSTWASFVSTFFVDDLGQVDSGQLAQIVDFRVLCLCCVCVVFVLWYGFVVWFCGVVVLCVVCVRDFRGSKIWLLPGPSLDTLSARPPNFSLFFALPPPFSLFSSLSGCLLVEFWWCLRSARTLKCARQPENSKRAHFRTPPLQTPPKFHEKTPKRGKKERKLWRESEKQREIFGLLPFGAHKFGASPSVLTFASTVFAHHGRREGGFWPESNKSL